MFDGGNSGSGLNVMQNAIRKRQGLQDMQSRAPQSSLMPGYRSMQLGSGEAFGNQSLPGGGINAGQMKWDNLAGWQNTGAQAGQMQMNNPSVSSYANRRQRLANMMTGDPNQTFGAK